MQYRQYAGITALIFTIVAMGTLPASITAGLLRSARLKYRWR